MIVFLWNKALKKLRGRAVKNSSIHSTSKIEAGSQIYNCQMDKYSFCGYDCKILNCQIGRYCSIADGVVIGGVQHPIEWVSTSPVFYSGRDSIKKKFQIFERSEDKQTIIGNDVWIGERATIKAGIVIGDGAVVGMGSIVTKNIGPYEIWAGNPAKLIRKRFNDNIIESLLNSKWWELDDEVLSDLSVDVREPEKFCQRIKEKSI